MPYFDENWLAARFLFLIPLMLSVTVHEWAHAWAALLLGDDTAAREGRVTLNPLEHVDPIGTFILPLLGVPFGWAKPVPINPGRFRHDVGPRQGVWLTAAAGPAANFCLALAIVLLMAVAQRLVPDALTSHAELRQLLESAVVLNVLLALFNLLPIPPLDGSRIVDGLLPYQLRDLWGQATACGPYAMAALLVILLAAGFNPLQLPWCWARQLSDLLL